MDNSINAQIAKALSIAGVPVYYLAPTINAVGARIIYGLISDVQDGTSIDKQEIIRIMTYTVDLWASNNDELDKIYKAINTNLQSIGMSRSNAIDLYDSDAKMYHRACTYNVLYNTAQQQII